VNVSYIQLKEEGFAERILELLEEVGLPGKALTIEVTESMRLQDYQYFNKIFYKPEVLPKAADLLTDIKKMNNELKGLEAQFNLDAE
jgi:hypothetical protein